MRLACAAAVLLLAAGSAQAADGEGLFNEYCSACHQKGGIGTPGLAPPLVSDILARAAANRPDYVPLVVLNGMSGRIEVAGQMFFSAMPAQPQLPDENIAAIASYVLGSLNGGSVLIDAAKVAALRNPKVGHAELRNLRAEFAR